MPDRESVIKGLECCQIGAIGCQTDCPYSHEESCKIKLTNDAIALLKDEKEYCNDCAESAIKTTVELQEEIARLRSLPKKQETKYPVCEKCGKEIDHINTSVFNYDGSDSDYSIPITYSKENGCVSFSTSQKWTGYDLTDEEQKEGIRCPYCGKFPFDDSIEIEFYEPVEVMMWTSEGR